MNKTARNVIISVGLVLIVGSVDSAENVTCWNCTSADVFCVSEPQKQGETCSGTACYTYIDGKTTVRGCSEPQGGCSTLCQHCEEEKCNNETFPENRRSCLQCSGGANCINTLGVQDLPCTLYAEADKCFTYIESVDKVVRGCVSDEYEACKTNERCNICEENNCNNKPVEISKLSCYKCSSVDGNKCKRPDPVPETCKLESSVEKCQTATLQGQDSKCFTYFEGDIVIRGCGNGPPNQANDNRIETCSENNCNDECAKVDSCYVCDSKDEAKCVDTSKLVGLNSTCGGSSCHTCESSNRNQTVRGCGNKDDSNLICKYCWGKDCNNDQIPTSCLSCSSSIDPKCAFNDSTINTKFCSDKNEKCYVMLDSSKVTKRGCISELSDKKCPANDSNCVDCEGHNCNDQVLVADSVDCFQCNGSDACAKDQNAVNGTSVKCSQPEDVCYMYSDDKGIYRGCLGDDKATGEACSKNPAKCFTCKTNGCNSKAESESSQLRCVICKSDDTNCKWSFKPSSAVPCNTSILFYQQELCYALYNLDGSTERGCLSQNSNCTLENTQCRVCYDSGCNTKSFASYSCIRCHSNKVAECANEKPKLQPSTCTNVPTAEQLGCYVYDRNGAIVRGCISDLDEIDQYNCKNDKYKSCMSCNDREGCNDMGLPGSATMMQASMTILLIAISFSINN